MTIRKTIAFVLILLFALDLYYSFLQQYHIPLDGDMPSCLIPGDGIQKLLKDPFGWHALIYQERYENPNRFFCHWTMYHYYHRMLPLVQLLFDPITSIYLVAAISKTLFQFLIILLLARIITHDKKFWSMETWLVCCLIFPLIQIHGYSTSIGIIDNSPTYAFFYAFPTVLLLALIYAFQKWLLKKSNVYKWIAFLFIPFVCLSGPLNPGICLLIVLLLFIKSITQSIFLQRNISIPAIYQYLRKQEYFIFLIVLGIFSVYSLYIGRFNSLEENNVVTLKEMYKKYSEAIKLFLLVEPCYVLFLSTIVFNFILLLFYKNQFTYKLIHFTYWLIAFSVLYVLLLPFGGYRVYRPLILRYDTMIPVTMCMIYLFACTVYYLLYALKGIKRMAYIPLLTAFLIIFIWVDDARFDLNKCEREALGLILENTNKTIKLPHPCNVVSWNIITDSTSSYWSMEMLRKLDMTVSNGKYYYQE